jgi:hypothetical protein
MARSVKWPEATRPATSRCGATYQASWGGAYEATCTRAEGHTSYHDDGVAWEKHEDYAARTVSEKEE